MTHAVSRQPEAGPLACANMGLFLTTGLKQHHILEPKQDTST